MNTNSDKLTSRREFLKTSAIVGGALMAPAILPGKSFAAGNSDTIKVGLIGCGGRGTGAAGQALKADKNVALTAMGDVFESQLHASMAALKNEVPDKVKVEPDHCFIGLDAFQKVIDSGVDVVLLTTPPGFRPQHLKAAVAAGKHIFCEKPVATDGPGIRSVLESVEEARRKKLSFVAGFCWRYHPPSQALFERILRGDIGEVQVVYGTYYTGVVKPMPEEDQRKPGMTDLEWQLRNWYNFGWLSGDGLVEQAIHAVDWMCWAMGDVPPLKAVAVGGRQIPSPGGNIFDHFDVNYEYANGARGSIGCRQQAGCFSDNTATIYGTKGFGRELGFNGEPFIKLAKAQKHKAHVPPRTTETASRKEPADWSYTGPHPDMYQVEHNHLFASIRKGEAVNDGVRLAHSTLTGIMGRMAAYTGQNVTWEMALNSKEKLVPENMTWDMPLTVAPRAMPGRTRFV